MRKFFGGIVLAVLLCGLLNAQDRTEPVVKPTDWPWCAVCDVACGNAGGSATLIGIAGKRGIAATAAHVVEQGNTVRLTFPGGYKCTGRVVGRNSQLDLAAIDLPIQEGMSTPRGVRAAKPSDKMLLAIGYPYYCKGCPHFTKGRNLGYTGTDIHFEAHPYIHSGFSGGCLLSEDGYYVGATNGYGEGYSYAASGQSMVRFFSKWVKVSE